MERLAQLIRWTGATTPEDHEARMEVWDEEIREQWFDRGYHEGYEAGCRDAARRPPDGDADVIDGLRRGSDRRRSPRSGLTPSGGIVMIRDRIAHGGRSMPRRRVEGVTRHAYGTTHRHGLGPDGLVGHPDSGQPRRPRDGVLPERRDIWTVRPSGRSRRSSDTTWSATYRRDVNNTLLRIEKFAQQRPEAELVYALAELSWIEGRRLDRWRKPQALDRLPRRRRLLLRLPL